MSLEDYKKKRNFKKTPEPKGIINKSKQNIFVIQKHDAGRLHYDFRLEINGVLKSWAIPKGPSLNPKEKRLAVETEDHPMDYAEFEGVIPEDNYGAGTVLIWDKGTFENKTQKNEEDIPIEVAYNDGHISVVLNGTKLKGGFALIKTQRKNQWLLIKKTDQEADTTKDILKEKPESVISKKKLEDF
jgi:DNA ligase D-like protein (predicted 3'-phosphoesterase)